jgi:hypothetical protein
MIFKELENFQVVIKEMYPWIPWEVVANPWDTLSTLWEPMLV